MKYSDREFYAAVRAEVLAYRPQLERVVVRRSGWPSGTPPCVFTTRSNRSTNLNTRALRQGALKGASS